MAGGRVRQPDPEGSGYGCAAAGLAEEGVPALRFEGPWKQGLPTFVSRQSRVCCLYHEKQQSKHSKGTGHMRRRRRNGEETGSRRRKRAAGGYSPRGTPYGTRRTQRGRCGLRRRYLRGSPEKARETGAGSSATAREKPWTLASRFPPNKTT